MRVGCYDCVQTLLPAPGREHPEPRGRPTPEEEHAEKAMKKWVKTGKTPKREAVIVWLLRRSTLVAEGSDVRLVLNVRAHQACVPALRARLAMLRGTDPRVVGLHTSRSWTRRTCTQHTAAISRTTTPSHRSPRRPAVRRRPRPRRWPQRPRPWRPTRWTQPIRTSRRCLQGRRSDADPIRLPMSRWSRGAPARMPQGRRA